MPKKPKSRGERKPPARRLVGVRCRFCDEPFIYATIQGLQFSTCPVCMSERLASGCLDASLRLALVVGELEAISARLHRGPRLTLKDQIDAVGGALGVLRDELAMMPPKY